MNGLEIFSKLSFNANSVLKLLECETSQKVLEKRSVGIQNRPPENVPLSMRAWTKVVTAEMGRDKFKMIL